MSTSAVPILIPAPEAIAHAARIIRDGGRVAIPTETVYGLAADATNGAAVAAIYATKGRPRFNPLIVHVASLDAARMLVEMPPLAEALAARFWPGPLTLVLPALAGNGIADLVSAGLDTLAVRVPAHPVALELIRACGRPLAAPSANRSGRISPTEAAHVAAEFADGGVTILDGGPCDRGVESTILDLTRPDHIVLLRAGAIPAEAIEALGLGKLVRPSIDANRPIAPGQLASHYAPRASVRLNVTHVEPGEALLAFGPAPLTTDGPVVNLSPSGDLTEAARNLFGALRQLDATGISGIAVMPIPAHGLGEAILDRLTRAAAPR